MVSGTFGNRYDGNIDADGVITASFANTGGDARLSLKGFDVDFHNEIEVLLNGDRLGFLSTGPNNGLNNGDSFSIAASEQVAGTNIITIKQAIDPGYVWGFTDLLLENDGGPPPAAKPLSPICFRPTASKAIMASMISTAPICQRSSRPLPAMTASTAGAAMTS